MNPYMLLLCIYNLLFDGWSFSSVVSYGLSLVKNVQIVLSMFIPEPKGTMEMKRGYFEIKYFADHGDGMKEHFVLLPDKGREATWTKVKAVLKHEYQAYVEEKKKAELLEREKAESKAAETKPDKTEQSLEDDIEDVASGKNQSSFKAEGSKLRTHSELQQRYKHCVQEDVTEHIMSYAGFNKDFFQIALTPKAISSSYQALIFFYGKGRQKIFEADDHILLV